MHKEQATLVNAQSHLCEGTRQNMRVTKHNNADQTFRIFYFLCVFGFLTQKQVKIDQKLKTFKENNKQTKICQNMLESKKTAKQSHNRLEELMHGHVQIMIFKP